MFDFQYFAPTKVAFGRNSLQKLSSLIAEQGCKKVLLHYGGGSAERSGLLSVVRGALAAAGAAFVELGGVKPNPRLSLVREGIALARAEGVDFLLAVGGGSVIDSAKAIGYGLKNQGDVWDFYEGLRKPSACLPVGVVLTIAAAGSEMSNSSVITNDEVEGWLKRSCNTDYARPRFAVMDPALTFTLPPYQTACGCTDILMHTMERYFTSGGNMQITDSLAEGLMRTVIANAKLLVRDPADYDARAEVMWAGAVSHNGLTGCGNNGGDWAVHGIEHELGGLYDVAHGAGLAAVWTAWANYVYKDCLTRFYLFAVRVMGVRPSGTREGVAREGIERFTAFLADIGMPVTLSELGVSPSDEDIARMARLCAATGGGKKGSAKILYAADIAQILKNAV